MGELWSRLLGRGKTGPGSAPEAVPLRLYTRSECCLCDEMKAVLAGVSLPDAGPLEELDIDADPELTERHGRSIPVLEIGGRVAFKGRLTEAELRKKYARLAREWRRRRAAEGS